MSFTTLRAGDRYLLGWNVIPKVAKSGYTAAVGDLVILDTSADNAVDLITTNEAPYGIVESLNNSNGTLSVAEFVSGVYIELPYSSAPTKGQKVTFGNATHGTSLDRTQVVGDNTNGAGTVVALDAACPHGTGHCMVRF